VIKPKTTDWPIQFPTEINWRLLLPFLSVLRFPQRPAPRLRRCQPCVSAIKLAHYLRFDFAIVFVAITVLVVPRSIASL
jgi:hypothetical protein